MAADGAAVEQPTHAGKWRPLRPFSTALVVALGVDSVVCVVHGVRLISEYSGLQGFTVREPWFLGRLHPILWPEPGGIFMWIVRWTTITLWLMWQFVAHQNLRERRLPGLRVWPSSAVVWWFIPFVNLVMPFRAMRELWSRAGEFGRRPDRHLALLVAWWIAFVAANALMLSAVVALLVAGYSAHSSNYLMVKPPVTMTDGQIHWLAGFWMFSAFVRAIAAIIAIAVILRISSWEDAVRPVDLVGERGYEGFARVAARTRAERALAPAPVEREDPAGPPGGSAPPAG
jgi:hypothetical protein